MHESTKETLNFDIDLLIERRLDLTEDLRLNSVSNSLKRVANLKKWIANIDSLMDELASKINEKEIL